MLAAKAAVTSITIDFGGLRIGTGALVSKRRPFEEPQRVGLILITASAPFLRALVVLTATKSTRSKGAGAVIRIKNTDIITHS